MIRQRAFRSLLTVLVVALAVPAVPAAPVPPGFAAVVIYATNSVELEQNSEVLSGSIVVNTASPGPTLACAGRELCVGVGVTTPAGYEVKADSIQVKSGGTIQGSAFCNGLTNKGSDPGLACSPLSLPVFDTAATFVAEAPRASAPDVFVPAEGSAVLPAGDYGVIDAAQEAVVTFTGGIYNVREIDFGTATTLEFLAPSEVRVEGKFSADQNSFIGPAEGSGLSAADIIFYVAGSNGNGGGLGATPKAAKIGVHAHARANFYVPNGTLHIRQNADVTGAFLARDVEVGVAASVALDSFFANRPPTADPQDVATLGSSPITITLTGGDPEGDDLVFSIASGPSEGSLGPVTQGPPAAPGDPPGCAPEDCVTPPVPARTSATVVYTPFTAGDVEDSFVFAVEDPGGLVGMAPVRINPTGDPTPPEPPLETVRADEAFAETVKNQEVIVTLKADAPDGVSLTFSIVAGSGPDDGELTDLVQGSGSPQRSATVRYTPDSDFTGTDTFTFEACGTIGASPACDTAIATITVAEGAAVADPQQVTTPFETPVEITLTGTAGAQAEATTITLVGEAAFLDGAEVAGNVADSDDDELGDNHNALPGPVPVLMSAGVDQAGGPGSNGVVRMQIEWDISGLDGLAGSLQSAQVMLTTNKGTVDSLDTFFYVGAEGQDAALTDSDFEAPATQISGVVMPVPPGPTGVDGSFSFDVFDELSAALIDDTTDVFSISARVDEGLAGGGAARGLQVYTTADGNLLDNRHPQLSLTTPPPSFSPLVFTILTLPIKGTLKDSFNVTISIVPTTLPDSLLTYTPNTGALGSDSFQFEVSDGATADTAIIGVIIGSAICSGGTDDNGRPCF